jgi:PAS domain S-box-containing protein
MNGPSKLHLRAVLPAAPPAPPAEAHVLIPSQPHDVVWVLDQEGRPISVDDRVHDLFGYWADEVVDAADGILWRRVHARDRLRVRDGLKALFAVAQAFDVRFRLRRRDGAWIWVEAHAVALARWDEGFCAYVVMRSAAHGRERPRRHGTRGATNEPGGASAPVERDLAAGCYHLEAAVRLLTSRTLDAVLVCVDRRVAYANGAFADSLETKATALVGRDVLELIDARDREAVATLLLVRERAIAPPELIDLRWSSRSGATALLRFAGLPVMHEGRPAVLLIGVPV